MKGMKTKDRFFFSAQNGDHFHTVDPVYIHKKMFLFTWRMMGSSVVVTLWKIRLIRFNRFSFFVVTRSYDLSYTSIAPQRILLK